MHEQRQETDGSFFCDIEEVSGVFLSFFAAEIPTLHEASMLWIVMHIAMTVKTGDQPSRPSMDAQICAAEVNDTRKGASMHLHVHLSIRAAVTNSLIWINERHEGGHEPDERELCESHPRRTALRGQI